MDYRLLVEGYIANFGISLDFLSFSVLDFFPFLFCFGFCVFLVHPTVVSVPLSALVERFDVSRMRDFYLGVQFINVLKNHRSKALCISRKVKALNTWF